MLFRSGVLFIVFMRRTGFVGSSTLRPAAPDQQLKHWYHLLVYLSHGIFNLAPHFPCKALHIASSLTKFFSVLKGIRRMNRDRIYLHVASLSCFAKINYAAEPPDSSSATASNWPGFSPFRRTHCRRFFGLLPYLVHWTHPK